MLSQMLQSITGLGGYTTFSTIIFFLVFLAVSYRAFRLDKGHVKYMSSIPLESSDPSYKEGE